MAAGQLFSPALSPVLRRGRVSMRSGIIAVERVRAPGILLVEVVVVSMDGERERERETGGGGEGPPRMDFAPRSFHL